MRFSYVLDIFANNIKLIFANMLGIFSLGIMPIVNIYISGFVLGRYIYGGYMIGLSIIRTSSAKNFQFYMICPSDTKEKVCIEYISTIL